MNFIFDWNKLQYLKTDGERITHIQDRTWPIRLLFHAPKRNNRGTPVFLVRGQHIFSAARTIIRLIEPFHQTLSMIPWPATVVARSDHFLLKKVVHTDRARHVFRHGIHMHMRLYQVSVALSPSMSHNGEFHTMDSRNGIPGRQKFVPEYHVVEKTGRQKKRSTHQKPCLHGKAAHIFDKLTNGRFIGSATRSCNSFVVFERRGVLKNRTTRSVVSMGPSNSIHCIHFFRQNCDCKWMTWESPETLDFRRINESSSQMRYQSSSNLKVREVRWARASVEDGAADIENLEKIKVFWIDGCGNALSKVIRRRT